jgi:RimJ/RimL family protein N-acetyltransferase
MTGRVTYRLMKPGEEEKICHLVEKVYDEFVAPDFSEEGNREFFLFANAEAMSERSKSDYFVLAAWSGEEPVGMIELGQYENIAMLFVAHRGRGIARELVHRALAVCRRHKPDLTRLHVHASP